MLILRRKVGEAIVLDERVTVYVLEIEGNRVKLGISAPSGVSVVRQELLTEPQQVGPLAEASQQTVLRGSMPRMGAHLPPVGGAR